MRFGLKQEEGSLITPRDSAHHLHPIRNTFKIHNEAQRFNVKTIITHKKFGWYWFADAWADGVMIHTSPEHCSHYQESVHRWH